MVWWPISARDPLGGHTCEVTFLLPRWNSKFFLLFRKEEQVRILSLGRVTALVTVISFTSAFSAEEPQTAAEAGLMQGFPPPEDKVVDMSNWLAPAYNRWGLPAH